MTLPYSKTRFSIVRRKTKTWRFRKPPFLVTESNLHVEAEMKAKNIPFLKYADTCGRDLDEELDIAIA